MMSLGGNLKHDLLVVEERGEALSLQLNNVKLEIIGRNSTSMDST